MNCKRCGHALGSNSALCPNCGAMMSNDQLKERKEMNGGMNPYIQKLNNVRSNTKWNNPNENSTLNNTGYAIFIVACIVLVAIVIALVLLRH